VRVKSEEGILRTKNLKKISENKNTKLKLESSFS